MVFFLIDRCSCMLEMFLKCIMWTLINILLALRKRYIVKKRILEYFCLPGRLRFFVNRRVKQYRITFLKKRKTICIS